MGAPAFMVLKNIGILVRKLYLSAFIGIGRYEKRLIGRPLSHTYTAFEFEMLKYAMVQAKHRHSTMRQYTTPIYNLHSRFFTQAQVLQEC